MIKPALFFLSILLIPFATAQTADIPALTGTGTGNITERFIAGWYVSDGATVAAGATQFIPIFGDSAPRTAESDVIAHATFYYNITNFRVVSNVATCGNLAAGEQFDFVLRKNLVATTLTGTCLATATANSFTLDTDIVAIAPGDRLTISVANTGTLLGRSLRVGISFEGFKSIPVNVAVTTNPVVDMTNEMLDTFVTFAPVIAFLLIAIWAEMSREIFVYALAIIAGGAGVISIWDGGAALIPILIGAMAILVYRAVLVVQETKMEIENA